MGSIESENEPLSPPALVPPLWETALLWNRTLRPETLRLTFPDAGFEQFRRSAVSPLLYDKEGSLSTIQEKLLSAKYRPKLVVSIIGPSTSGKTVIRQRLRKMDCAVGSTQVVTTVTRLPREDEARQLKTVEAREYRYVSEAVFQQMVQEGKFIETVPHGGSKIGEFFGLLTREDKNKGITHYGTTVVEMERALADTSDLPATQPQLVFIPVNQDGVLPVKQWLAQHHPDIPIVTVSVILGVTWSEMVKRIVQKRGLGQALSWRIREAYDELHNASELADFLLQNPIEKDGPVKASEAMCILINELSRPWRERTAFTSWAEEAP